MKNQHKQITPLRLEGPYSEETQRLWAKKETAKGARLALNTLAAFKEIYKDEETVLSAIFNSRLAKSEDKCEGCGHPITIYYRKVVGQPAYKCKLCNKKIFPLKDTPLAKTHVRLAIIVEIIFRMFNSKGGLPANRVAEYYGIKNETAWSTLHRIRKLFQLASNNDSFLPTEEAEMDEVYITTKNYGDPHPKKLKRGHGSQRVTPVYTVVGRTSGVAKAYIYKHTTAQNALEVLNRAGLTTQNPINTDESPIYSFLESNGYQHKKCHHRTYKWVGDDKGHTNSCEGLHHCLKNPLYRVYNGVSRRHLEKYLDECIFRFTKRKKTSLEMISDIFKALPPFVKTEAKL
ncbi:MAG: IS1595 family transposase [Bacteroidota bacterium]